VIKGLGEIGEQVFSCTLLPDCCNCTLVNPSPTSTVVCIAPVLVHAELKHTLHPLVGGPEHSPPPAAETDNLAVAPHDGIVVDHPVGQLPDVITWDRYPELDTSHIYM